ncbi:MAG: hypothetical protein KKF33_00875, partial [Alphaproteobacteria bacterium]|nr:hypothetical protein [Alphaproteobacteria bacterium]
QAYEEWHMKNSPFGVVLAVGPDVRNCKVGQEIEFGCHSGKAQGYIKNELESESKYIYIKDRDVLSVIKRREE